jgi:hypothetical protein
MDASAELQAHLTGGSRVIVIAERDIDLRPTAEDNSIFLLKVAEGSLAAGGRGGGYGERRVVLAACFQLRAGEWSKAFESPSEEAAGEFEVPYHVSRIPMFLPDGSEAIGYGVVDAELVAQMLGKSKGATPA